MASLNRDISYQTILIPLDGILIEFPFQLGRVNFYYFTKSDIDIHLQHFPKDLPDLEKYSEKFRKTYQGRVYTKFQYKAEKNFAQNLAFYHTDRALEILKLFNPAAFEIRTQCFLCRHGQITPPQWQAFHELPNGKLLLSDGIEYGHSYDFFVNMELLHHLHKSGFGIANQLLCKIGLTDLEQRCLEAISHFAHGVSSTFPQDRLLHALVAVESLLLRDTNEPIKGSLSYRVARLATSTIEDRRKAKQDFLKGYDLRSKFVHRRTSLMIYKLRILCFRYAVVS